MLRSPRASACFVFLLWAGCVAAQAPITAVTLYPGSATIERTAAVTPGMTRLEVSGLPAAFDVQTLRIQADAGIRVGEVVSRDTAHTAPAHAKEAELETKLQGLQDQVAALDADIAAANLMKSFIEGLSARDANKTVSVDAKTVETVRSEAAALFARIQKAEVGKRELSKKVEAVERDLERVRGGARDLRSVTVQLSAERAGNLRLSYQLNNAGWKPVYRAELDANASKISLERLAQVSQQTGEDWHNVKLRLSTGQPTLSPDAREPNPWTLTYFKEHPPMPAAVAAAPAAASIARKEVAQDVREIQTTFATEFEVPVRTSIASDGREVRVALGQHTLPVTQKVRIVPRVEKSAVVTAELNRPEGVWLNGEMQLIRDGNYAGSTFWDPQANDRFVLSFGRDDLIRVTLDRVKTETGRSGLISSRITRKTSDVIAVTSFHTQPIDVLILESSPVGTHEEIKVERVFEPKPGIENWNKKPGVMGWEKKLAPKETLKIKANYSIGYPAQGFVGGLD